MEHGKMLVLQGRSAHHKGTVISAGQLNGARKHRKMRKIEDCLHCGKCKSQCPYELDTPTLLAKNYEDYKQVLAGKVSV